MVKSNFLRGLVSEGYVGTDLRVQSMTTAFAFIGNYCRSFFFFQVQSPTLLKPEGKIILTLDDLCSEERL